MISFIEKNVPLEFKLIASTRINFNWLYSYFSTDIIWYHFDIWTNIFLNFDGLGNVLIYVKAFSWLRIRSILNIILYLK